MPLMAVLMIFMIVVLALATFVESAYGTQAAWAVVYGTTWFEVMFLLVAVNLIGVLFSRKLHKRRKLIVFLFHIAFILILAGAAITRFISFEGTMHIRENDLSNTMLSDNAYVQLLLESGGDTVRHSEEVTLTELTPRNFRFGTRVGGEKVKIRSTGYLANAMEQYVAAPGGEPFLQVMLVTEQQSSVSIPSGSVTRALGMRISFNAEDPSAMLKFHSEGEDVFLIAPFPVTVMQMGGGSGETYQPGEPVPVGEGRLYNMGHIRMALQNYLPSAKKQLVSAPQGQMGSHLSAARMEISYRGMRSEAIVPGMPGMKGEPVSGTMGDLNYRITYGSKEIPIPFALFLKDFQVERYPGSNSPSSFASEVILIDKEMDLREERRIFMNNVLKHRGYRFYQASYDNDEQGTILSVNKDRAGTLVTYAGYLLLIAGMVLALFIPGTRFARLARLSAPAAKVLLPVLFLSGSVTGALAQMVPPKDVAQEFGKIWVQDRGGRYEPMNTLAREVVRKISRKSRIGSYSADQVLLGMVMYPEQWQREPLFEIKHPGLHELTGYKGEMVSFNDLLDTTGNYVLRDLVNQAYSNEVASQSELDREVIKLDDRVNAMYLVQSGGLLRIFPDPGADNHRWASVSEALQGKMIADPDSMGRVFLRYLNALQQGDYSQAELRLDRILEYQRAEEGLLPDPAQKRLELLYNRLNLFPKLARFYGIFGIFLMVLQFLIVFRPKKIYRWLFRVGVIHLAVGFALHTLALVMRWYISGHAPMSNGYESLIFVSWVTLLAGLIFVRRSGYAMALTAILGALSLMVAGLSNMNPEITNLVPVLKSPWLAIHVTVIMAGYGFLGLASLLGLLNVVLFATLSASNRERMKEVIGQVTTVNHLTLIIGLYFMTAGVFLGGVWANESWGRYWGWDPKETWALITVLVYAFVSHMHRIPGLRGQFAFNLASFISYFSVLMTYFGVNYFLGGIHSYASGSSFRIPYWTYLILLALIGLSVLAHRKQEKLLPEAGRSPEEDRE